MDVTDIYTIVFLIITDLVILVKNLIYIRFIRSKPQGRKTFIGKSFYSLNLKPKSSKLTYLSSVLPLS